MFYSGGVNAENDAVIMLRTDVVKCMTKVGCYSDRLIFWNTSVNSINIVTVQVCMPKTHHNEDEMAIMYDLLRNQILLSEITKGTARFNINLNY